MVGNQEDVVEGAITVSPLVRNLDGFQEYFTNLTPETNRVNPWFPEFWEEHFNCKLSSFKMTPHNQFYHWCSNNKRIGSIKGFKPTGTLHFIRDSVYAFAHALHDMHYEDCNGRPGLCPEMNYANGEKLKGYLEKVTFKG